MLELVRAALARATTDRPVDPSYFFFSGYLTPNGELHFGHLGGPYLRSDALARHMELHGAKVVCATGSDSYESGVAFAAATPDPGRAGEIAAHYTARAESVLRRMQIRQDSFVNPSAPGSRELAAQACHEHASALAQSGRLEVRTERVLVGSPPAPPAAIGSFVLGRCAHCGISQTGNVCETCGRWMSPVDPEASWNPNAPASGSRPQARGDVASVFVRVSRDMSASRMERVVEPEFEYLVDDYRERFGDTLRLSYASWWGLPWTVPLPTPPHPQSVFSSYVMVKYASSRVLGRLHGADLGGDPFRRGSGVTTVAVGGLDSAFGWISLHALTDERSDFEPFDHVVVNRFMLLHGEKFSTSRRHVIRVHDALDRGISPDVIRLMLARVAPSRLESEFVTADAARRAEADCALLAAAAGSAPAGGPREAKVEPSRLALAGELLARQRAAFELPGADLPAAVEPLLAWAAAVREDKSMESPTFDRQVLAVLAYPIMPGWARAVWQTAAAGSVAVPGLETVDPAVARPDARRLEPPRVADLDRLVEQGRAA